MGEMVQGGVGYDGVEAAQSFARLEEVPRASRLPGRRGSAASLAPEAAGDVYSDDPRYAL